MILHLALLVSCSPVDDSDSGLMVEPKVFTNSEIQSLRRHWPLPDVPLDTTNSYGDDPYAQHLGQYLFYDTRFSENGEVSCATCHDPDLGWSDGKQIADTLLQVNRHTPSLWNAGYLRWAYWDGR
jgi:cytochrome c peroxidase